MAQRSAELVGENAAEQCRGKPHHATREEILESGVEEAMASLQVMGDPRQLALSLGRTFYLMLAAASAFGVPVVEIANSFVESGGPSASVDSPNIKRRPKETGGLAGKEPPADLPIQK